MWVAGLLYQYKKLSPDSFVLPFDPHAVIGTDKKISEMLSVSNMTNKRHYAWRELIAKKRRGERGAELPIFHDNDNDNDNEDYTNSDDDVNDDVTSGSGMAADDSEGHVITGSGVNTEKDLEASFNEVTPAMTYLVSTGGLATFRDIRDGDDIVRFVSGGLSGLPLVPDRLACVFRSKAQMHYVSVVFPAAGVGAAAAQLERLDGWAEHSIEAHFCSKGLNGYNTLRNIVRMGVIFREVPPAVVSGLATLLSTTKNSQREAAMLLRWVPPYAWAGHVKDIYSFVVPMLLGTPSDAFYGLYAVECAIRRLAATCELETPASAFYGTVLPVQVTRDVRILVVTELCKYSFTAAKKLVKNSGECPLATLEALLSLLEATAEAAGKVLPEMDLGKSFPDIVVERLFAVPSAMFVSRTLGALAVFGGNAHLAENSNKGFAAVVAKIRRALADPEGRYSLAAHPGLRHLAASFAEKARMRARAMMADGGGGENSNKRVDTSMENIMRKHKASLVRFYANHSLDGVKSFVDMWPFDTD